FKTSGVYREVFNMPRRVILFSPDQFYHVYNRGNDRQPIFFDRENYLFFLRRVKEYLAASVEIHAFCLMPNHYHLLLRMTKEVDFSDAMKKLLISYTKAINKKYQKVGHLFQGSFKAKLVDSPEYFLHLSRYIHLNPRIAGLVKYPQEWEFSSYREYLGLRKNELVMTEFILSQFRDLKDYQKYVGTLTESEIEKLQESF
ncbi:MAG: transposase, partial [Bacteroidota bacterium]